MGAAHAIATGAIDEVELASLDRAAATEMLVGLRGIGHWSAEHYFHVLLDGLAPEVNSMSDTGVGR